MVEKGTVLTILKNCFKWKSSDKYWETFPNKNRGDIRMYILSNVITVFYVISLFISIDFLYVIHRCSHIKQECVGEDKGRHGSTTTTARGTMMGRGGL